MVYLQIITLASTLIIPKVYLIIPYDKIILQHTYHIILQNKITFLLLMLLLIPKLKTILLLLMLPLIPFQTILLHTPLIFISNKKISYLNSKTIISPHINICHISSSNSYLCKKAGRFIVPRKLTYKIILGSNFMNYKMIIIMMLVSIMNAQGKVRMKKTCL